MEDFLSLKLEQTLMDSIAKLNYKTPTPIQAQAIPVALAGKDILGTAQTGTGKTAAFALPALHRLEKPGERRALAVGACDMDGRRHTPFRATEIFEQRIQPV